MSIPEAERLELYVEPWNQASWRAAEANGYQREGLLRLAEGRRHTQRHVHVQRSSRAMKRTLMPLSALGSA
jgi:RimJ/RimL family protein N-acetyltransferase